MIEFTIFSTNNYLSTSLFSKFFWSSLESIIWLDMNSKYWRHYLLLSHGHEFLQTLIKLDLHFFLFINRTKILVVFVPDAMRRFDLSQSESDSTRRKWRRRHSSNVASSDAAVSRIWKRPDENSADQRRKRIDNDSGISGRIFCSSFERGSTDSWEGISSRPHRLALGNGKGWVGTSVRKWKVTGGIVDNMGIKMKNFQITC